MLAFRDFIFCSEIFIYNKAYQFMLSGNQFLTFVSSLGKRRGSADTYLVYYKKTTRLYVFLKGIDYNMTVLSTNSC